MTDNSSNRQSTMSWQEKSSSTTRPGSRFNEPSRDDPDAQVLAVTLGAVEPWEADLHIMMNMSNHSRYLPLPGVAGRDWHRAIDTSLASPDDVLIPPRQPPVDASSYKVSARSVVVFETRQGWRVHVAGRSRQ